MGVGPHLGLWSSGPVGRRTLLQGTQPCLQLGDSLLQILHHCGGTGMLVGQQGPGQDTPPSGPGWDSPPPSAQGLTPSQALVLYFQAGNPGDQLTVVSTGPAGGPGACALQGRRKGRAHTLACPSGSPIHSCAKAEPQAQPAGGAL